MPEDGQTIPIKLMFESMRKRLAEALTLAKAAEACAHDGYQTRALELSLDIEPLFVDANHLLQAASVVQRLNKESHQT